MTNQALETGQEVWIEYEKGTYLGFEEGQHRVLLKRKNEDVIRRVNAVLTEDGWEPPRMLRTTRGPLRYSGRKNVWSTGGLHFVYYYAGLSTFKSEEILKRDYIEISDVMDGSEFWTPEKICEELDAIYLEGRPLAKQIEELQKQLNEIQKKRLEVYAKCFHEWEKDEEEETSPGSYKQRCECIHCGKEEYSRYSKLF